MQDASITNLNTGLTNLNAQVDTLSTTVINQV
jgi:hypothetical protein